MISNREREVTNEEIYRRLPFLRAFHRKGRRKDPDSERRFASIAMLWKQGKKWEEIAKLLAPEFGYVSADACKKHFRRYVPEYLKWLRLHFPDRYPDISENEFLKTGLRFAKRRAGRPKSGHK